MDKEQHAKALQRRTNHGVIKLETRAEGSGLQMLAGHGAVFNQETVIQDWWYDYREKILPGAFAQDIAGGADVRALVDHLATKVIARTKNKTLRLSEDTIGLYSEIDPSDTTDGRDIVEKVRRGDVDGMSIGFFIRKQQWTESKDEMDLREILDVQLVDVSPVTFPAYPQTDISARNLLQDSELDELKKIGRLICRAKTDRLKEGDEEEAERLIEQLRKIFRKDRVIEEAPAPAFNQLLLIERELELLTLED
ncbi:MAG: HK97 family phage prohead protease [Candidatus Melainabacteria bacterium]|nr:HK97 family phage prohead protease [Candidatus Melainabacteria bacterium]